MVVNGWELDLYATGLRARKLSEGTVRLRLAHLGKFARSHPDPWVVTSGDVVEWLAGCRSAEYAKSVRSSLSSYFVWAIRCDLTDRDPTVKVPNVRVPRPKARPCPEPVYKAALLAADEDETLMLLLMAESGLRCMEVAGMHTRDVSGGTVRITGKGGHVRVLPVSAEAARRLSGRPTGWVFPGRFPGEHVRPGTVGKKVAALLGGGWTAHTLRHRCGTRAYNEGGRDLIAVQRLLGHSSVATTQRYLAGDEDALRRLVAVTSA